MSIANNHMAFTADTTTGKRSLLLIKKENGENAEKKDRTPQTYREEGNHDHWYTARPSPPPVVRVRASLKTCTYRYPQTHANPRGEAYKTTPFFLYRGTSVVDGVCLMSSSTDEEERGQETPNKRKNPEEEKPVHALSSLSLCLSPRHVERM